VRTYKRKLILNKTQEQRLRQWIGVCRLVYNMSIEIRECVYKSQGKSIHKYELMKQLSPLRGNFAWIKAVPAESLQGAIDRMDNSYKQFFKGAGHPKFASKKFYKSILFKTARVEGDFIVIPKLGKVRMAKDVKVTGVTKTSVIKIEPTGFFVSIVCDNVPKKFNSENQTVGLDMGISKFCVTSDGDVIENPRHFEKYEKKLRIENRALARKKKDSNSWLKQVRRLTLLHRKIANVRTDFLHKESTKIAKANSTVFVEDLDVSLLTKNRNFSKSIKDCGWGMFRQMLEYKTQVVRVDPAYTSQQCFECKHTTKENRKTQSEFKCVKCGHTDHADINAAKNIKSRGTALVSQRSSLEQAFGEESKSKDMSGECLKF
jgi:putative transposase